MFSNGRAELLPMCILVVLLSWSTIGIVSQEPLAKVDSPPLVKPAAPLEDTPAISTERPSAGFSADVIPGGSVQMEYGLNVSTRHHGAFVDGPESLIRVGVTNRFEGRVTSNNLVYESSATSGTSKFQNQDPNISTKFLISKANSFAPKSAIVSLSLPLGSAALTSGSYDPGLTAVWTQSLPHGFSLIEVAQGTLTTNAGARVPIWAPSFYVGPSLSDHLSLFGEYAPIVETGEPYAYVVDGGLEFLPARTKQIDARFGYSRDGNGVHYLFSFGYSIRRALGPSISND